MTTTTFEGVLPALITPFSADGRKLDIAALNALIERCIDAGVSGLVANGSTGEFPTLSHDERRRVVEAVIAASRGRVPTVAATSALSTAEAVELSVHAAEAGAAAVMVVPPWYGAPTWPEVVAHYRAISARITIPIMYYHLPSASGTTLTPDRLRDLGEVGVTCFKDSAGDAVAAAAFLHRGNELPTLLNGADTLSFSALAAGVRGLVWGIASFIPGPCVQLYRALAIDADLVDARALWSKIYPICELVESLSYPAAVKAGCRHVGLSTGPVRAPLLDLDASDASRLADLIDELSPVVIGSR